MQFFVKITLLLVLFLQGPSLEASQFGRDPWGVSYPSYGRCYEQLTHDKRTEAEKIADEMQNLVSTHPTSRNHAIRSITSNYFSKLSTGQMQKLISVGTAAVRKAEFPLEYDARQPSWSEDRRRDKRNRESQFDDFTHDVLAGLFGSLKNLESPNEVGAELKELATVLRTKMKEHPKNPELLHRLLVRADVFLSTVDSTFHDELISFFLVALRINPSDYLWRYFEELSKEGDVEKFRSELWAICIEELESEKYYYKFPSEILANLLPKATNETFQLPKSKEEAKSDLEVLLFVHLNRIKTQSNFSMSSDFIFSNYEKITNSEDKEKIFEIIWEKSNNNSFHGSYLMNSLLKLKYKEKSLEIIFGEAGELPQAVRELRAPSYGRWVDIGLGNSARLEDYDRTFAEIMDKAEKIHFKLTLALSRNPDFAKVFRRAAPWTFKRLREALAAQNLSSYQSRPSEGYLPFVTEMELYSIVSNPQWLAKTIFYDGDRVFTQAEIESLFLKHLPQ